MKKKEQQSEDAGAEVSGENQTGDTTQEFPGYPKYPSSEDIMNQGERIDVDVEVVAANLHHGKIEEASAPHTSTAKTSSDLTEDDFQALGSDELQTDGDDEILANRVWPVDFAGDDLDIPGSEADDAQEAVGSEDEENNSYSIGGDRHEDLEEDHS